MLRSLTLPIFLTSMLSGCAWFDDLQYKAGLHSFRITEARLDQESGELELFWEKAYSAEMYRVWISPSKNCNQPQSEILVGGTSHKFGRVGPGQFFGCVEALLEVHSYSTNSCTNELSSSGGTNQAASNQGKPFGVEAQRQGEWRKLADGISSPTLLGNQGGIILQVSYPAEIHVLDEAGTVIKKARPLPAVQFQKAHYVHAEGQLLGFISDTQSTRLMLWDESRVNWRELTKFQKQSLIGFHLINAGELIFALYDSALSRALWFSLSPADPALPKNTGVVSLASELGNVFFNVASLYQDGGFIIADDRGLYRLTTSEITTMARKTGMSPQRIYAFPGSQHEYLIQGLGHPSLAPAAGLLCSMAYIPVQDWWTWNAEKQELRQLTRTENFGFDYAIAEGPIAMNFAVAGRFLELLADKPMYFSPPPFANGSLLPGPQLPNNQVLVSSQDELWFFTPSP